MQFANDHMLLVAVKCGGPLLGGGFGRLARKYSLTLDNINANPTAA